MNRELKPLQREGILYVISAPSGAGKTSLCREIIDFYPALRHSVSYTTRPAREGETEGVDYHFVSPERFASMIEKGEFAEWAEVHGNRYGTAMTVLKEAREAGQDILLDIDCQGAAQLKEKVPQGVFLFILPPSLAELERRLLGRNTDSAEVIERRVANASWEVGQAYWYDYLVINDDFDVALEDLKAIFRAERCRTDRLIGSLTDVVGKTPSRPR